MYQYLGLEVYFSFISVIISGKDGIQFPEVILGSSKALKNDGKKPSGGCSNPAVDKG